MLHYVLTGAACSLLSPFLLKAWPENEPGPGTALFSVCLTSPTPFILLPLASSTACSAPGTPWTLLAQYQSLVSQAGLPWSDLPQATWQNLKRKALCFQKCRSQDFLSFPSCLEQHCSLWRSYMQLPLAK